MDFNKRPELIMCQIRSITSYALDARAADILHIAKLCGEMIGNKLRKSNAFITALNHLTSLRNDNCSITSL